MANVEPEKVIEILGRLGALTNMQIRTALFGPGKEHTGDPSGAYTTGTLQRLKADGRVSLLKGKWSVEAEVVCPTCKGAGRVVRVAGLHVPPRDVARMRAVISDCRVSADRDHGIAPDTDAE